MLPWSKAVCCIVVSIGQGDAGRVHGAGLH